MTARAKKIAAFNEALVAPVKRHYELENLPNWMRAWNGYPDVSQELILAVSLLAEALAVPHSRKDWEKRVRKFLKELER